MQATDFSLERKIERKIRYYYHQIGVKMLARKSKFKAIFEQSLPVALITLIVVGKVSL